MPLVLPDYQNAIPQASPNYWVGRSGYLPRFIVAHGTAGAMRGCLDWLCSTQSGGSVHYLVDRAGVTHQMVSEWDSAWGNGIPEPPSDFVGGPNPNLLSLSIEAERTDPGNTSPITPAQKAALIALVADIRRRHGPLPLIPHSAISPQSRAHCPGDGYPLDEIDRASAPAAPKPGALTLVRFDATPQRLPLIFYADASFTKPLYPSAATTGTTLHFDAWRLGEAVLDPSTQQSDRRWYRRFNVHGNTGFTPSAWVLGNAPNSQP